VRSATVIVPYRDGFVLAGRSLVLTEGRERDLGALALLGLLATLLATGLACLGSTWLRHAVSPRP